MARPRLLIAVTHPLSGIFFRGQLAYLAEQGFEVHLLSSPGEPAAGIAQSQGAVFHALAMERGISPWRDLRALLAIIALLRRLRPALVNAGTPKAGMLVGVAAWWCRVPVRIYTIHGLRFETARGPLRALLMAIERVVCAAAHTVVCVGPGLRSLVSRQRLCPDQKLVVLGAGSANGIDLAGFSRTPAWTDAGLAARRELGIPVGAPVIGFVGRLVRDKGRAELARAWRGIRTLFPQACLVVVGDVEAGDPHGEAERAELAADARVRITGFVAEVRPYYTFLDVLALPTYREGLPTVLLEAAAMSVPVVCTAIPGCIDIVDAGRTGTLVEVGDAQQLEAAIVRYLLDPALAGRHARAAHALVAERFAQPALWARYAQFYRDQLRRVDGGARLAADAADHP